MGTGTRVLILVLFVHTPVRIERRGGGGLRKMPALEGLGPLMSAGKDN